MESPLAGLTAALRQIRDRADAALKTIEKPAEPRALAWKCKTCGHVKHFTRPATAEVARPCAKCHGASFEPRN